MRSEYLSNVLPARRSKPAQLYVPQPWTTSSDIISSAVPNGRSLTGSASSMVQSLLSGLPGTSRARRAGAYRGIASGMPNSEYASNVGYDLYNTQADAYQQRGFDDLLSLIGATTSPELQSRSQSIQLRGQDINQAQYGSDLKERQRQFDTLHGRRFSGMSLGNIPTGGSLGTINPGINNRYGSVYG